MDKYNIRDFDDIESQIALKRNQIKSKNIKMKKNQEKFEKVLKTTEMANDYIRLHTVYEYAMSYKSKIKIMFYLKRQKYFKYTK